MEFRPAEDSGNSTEQEHGVEKNEAADGGVRVLAENHQSDQPDSRALQVQLTGGKVSQRNAENAPEGIECAHKGVVELFGIGLAGFELE